MKIKHSIIFAATISTISSLVCMELQLDVSPAQLPALKKPYRYINFDNKMEAFDVLTKNEASLLRTLVGKEQGGKYSETLHKSEKLLHEINNIGTNHLNSDFAKLVKRRYAIGFIAGIANKQKQRECLISAFNDDAIATFATYTVSCLKK